MPYRLSDVRYRVRPIADPAAGAGFTHQVAGQFAQVVRSLVATLTTDANVGNRQIVVTADDGSTTYFRTGGITVAASTVADHVAFNGADSRSVSLGQIVRVGWPSEGLILYPGHRLVAALSGAQVGDQLTGIALLLWEYETGPVAPGEPIPPFYVPELDPTYVG